MAVLSKPCLVVTIFTYNNYHTFEQAKFYISTKKKKKKDSLLGIMFSNFLFLGMELSMPKNFQHYGSTYRTGSHALKGEQWFQFEQK